MTSSVPLQSESQANRWWFDFPSRLVSVAGGLLPRLGAHVSASWVRGAPQETSSTQKGASGDDHSSGVNFTP